MTPAADKPWPPYDEGAERAVLGSVLLDDTRVMDICADTYGITPDSFRVPGHRTIYAAMLDSRKAVVPIDVNLLSGRLRDSGDLDTIGGDAYLDQLCDQTPTAAHAEYYAAIVVQKHKLRRMIAAHERAIQACYDAGMDADPDAMLDSSQSELARLDAERMTTEPTWQETVGAVMADAEAQMESGRRISGLSTGFINLDRTTSGLKPSEVTIIAAMTSQGKTSLAMNIAENVALGKGAPDGKGKPVGIFSAEMAAKALAKRMLCANAQVDSFRLDRGAMARTELSRLVQAASRIGPAPIYVDDTGGLDVAQVRIRARRWRDKHGIELLIVDYLQLLHDHATARQGRQVEVSEVSAGMKACAKELGIPVLVACQLNRSPDLAGRAGKPKLTDLRESGRIEQDADVVWLLRRPCRNENDPDHADKTLAIIDVAKHRNGPTGDVLMNFLEELTQFQDRAAPGVDRDSGRAREWYEDDDRANDGNEREG